MHAALQRLWPQSFPSLTGLVRERPVKAVKAVEFATSVEPRPPPPNKTQFSKPSLKKRSKGQNPGFSTSTLPSESLQKLDLVDLGSREGRCPSLMAKIEEDNQGSAPLEDPHTSEGLPSRTLTHLKELETHKQTQCAQRG